MLSGRLSKSDPLHFGSKKVFPQTFLTQLSWVISKSKDFSFCKYVKIIFLELKTIVAEKCINFSLAEQKIAQIEKLAAQKPPNVTKNCYDPYIKCSFKGKKCMLLLIYFVLSDPENLSVTTRHITF